MQNKHFCHLHLHDQYSQLDGYGSAKQFTSRASELGFTHLGVTNHGNIDGVIKFQQACNSADIKPIFGCELYIVPNILIKEKEEKKFHIVAFIQDELGLKNLFKMLSKANLEGFFKRPRVDPDILKNYAGGLLFTSACASSFINMPGGEELLLDLHSQKKIFLEVMPHNYEPQRLLNIKKNELSKRYNIPLVATNDCHYPLAEHAKTQEVLLAIQSKAKWKDPKRWKFEVDGLYLRTADEMLRAFQIQNVLPSDVCTKALQQSLLIARMCDFTIEKKPVFLPKLKGYEDRDETELMREIIEDGFQKRIVKKIPVSEHQKYRERLEEEFSLICELGFQGYFLIVWELVSWCRKNDILVGPGRGSVGGSLVAYLMFITDVDPIKYGLVFARFISAARIDLPDIDIDFEDVKRDRVRKHLEEQYGAYNVSSLSTFLTMKGRAALRDVARVFDIPYNDVDKAAKAIVQRSGGDFRADFTIEDAFETFEDGINFKNKYPEATKIAIDLEGQIRGSGVHAAGMCVTVEDLREGERCNLANRRNLLVANWEKEDAEYMGIMKLDILGLAALSILNESRRLIKQNYDIDIDFDEIPLDDEKVLAEANAGNTVGVFQIGSLGLSKYCRELGINSFDDIVHATSLWRPGTLRSGTTFECVERKHGRMPIKYIHEKLIPVTKETYGIIIYQEQIMWFMYELGGLPWKTVDHVRKVISKSKGAELFQQHKQLFIDGCKERGTLPPDEASKVWDGLSSFGSFAFNKAHAVEYSLISYWDMYIKTHWPKEFICACLSFGNQNDKYDLIEECKRLEIQIELPKVGFSHPTKWMTTAEENKIFAPFIEIKGVGEKVAEQIASLNKPEGFFGDKKLRKPNKKVMEILENIKANSDEPLTDQELAEASEYFNFDLTRDPMGRYRGISDSLQPLLHQVGKIDFSKPSKEFQLYFGKMIEVRYGYRHNVLRAQKDGTMDRTGLRDTVAGTGDHLGGVYGTIKDESDYTMIVFDPKIYMEKKSLIEHCENKWVLASAAHPKKSPHVICDKVWIGDELLNCELSGFPGNLLKIRRVSNHNGLLECRECYLRDECRKPVLPSPGRVNVVIVGEAPGLQEDRQGKGFVGPAGSDVLWPELLKYNLKRENFHITNLVKCYPSKTKTPSAQHINTCSKWFEQELQELHPIAILAFGRTSLKFFKDLDSGIVDHSGTTEWNNKYKCWIHWCIHPASVLYQPSNRGKFEEGIENFARKLNYISGK